ncbi:MAG: translation initiation factor IF-3 [Alphaproteobacteria bacterium]|nr:translation initiation factor IF-3 [Alphaproteobacteria bacterium]
MKPQTGNQTPPNEGYRVNREIRARQVRVIDPEGTMLGVMSVEDGVKHAQRLGLDLVEVSPQTDPPVCKILDYGKFKYQAQKKRVEAKKNQKVITIKEIKFRPVTDSNDYMVKRKAIERFLEEGDKVKVTMRFRGREMAHHEIGLKLLERLQEDLTEVAKVEQNPKIEGKQIVMMLSPKV